MERMIDLHCHILHDVDDGAPDLDTSVDMARALVNVGFTHVAASPHFGEGPGGDVAGDIAASRRADLTQRLTAEGIDLTILPNAEHHVTPTLFQRLRDKQHVPVGGKGNWLLVELPWSSIPRPEDVLFRLQLGGHRLILAHPERYSYLEVDTVQRLVGRGVRMQLELGSFVGVYGDRAHKRAMAIMKDGLAHVLATDLHRPKQAEIWLAQALQFVRKRFGPDACSMGLTRNPQAILDNVASEDIDPL
jgi:protein-tyrosine phosphatase